MALFGSANDPQTVAAVTAPTALTDSGTGTPGDTIAAGIGVYDLVLPMTFKSGTSAEDYATGIVLGHKFKLLSWEFITDVVGVGASASRVFNMEIGTTDVGTTPSTLTLTEAATATKGARVAGTAIAGANTGTAAAALSVEVASGGTQFTAGSGYLVIKVQNMDTADAVASLAAKVNALLGASGITKFNELLAALKRVDTNAVRGQS